MDKNKKLRLRIDVENALYKYTMDNVSLEDIEEIRVLFNSIIDDFIRENNIIK